MSRETFLRELRERLGISQGEAARRAGIQAPLYGQYENGQRYPHDEHVRKIARALGEPDLPEHFLTREDVRAVRGHGTLVVAVKRLARKMGIL